MQRHGNYNCNREWSARYQRGSGYNHMLWLFNDVNSDGWDKLYVVAGYRPVCNYRRNCDGKPRCYDYLYCDRYDGRVQQHSDKNCDDRLFAEYQRRCRSCHLHRLINHINRNRRHDVHVVARDRLISHDRCDCYG